jgi:hypothetical protein
VPKVPKVTKVPEGLSFYHASADLQSVLITPGTPNFLIIIENILYNSCIYNN